MSICVNCGTAISEGMSFCPECGTPVSQAAPVTVQHMEAVQMNTVQQTARMRPEYVSVLERTKQYFLLKQNEYDELDELSESIPKFVPTRVKALLVMGIITAVFGLIFCCMDGGAGPIFFGIILLLAGAGMITGFAVKNVNRKKTLDKMVARNAELTAELSEYYAAYGPCIIGEEYSNPKIIEAICSVIRNGRADSPKEAINCLIDDTHRENMEAMAQQTMVNSAAAASHARSSAIFSAATFFLR